MPLTANDRSASLAGSMVPVVVTLWLTVEDETVAVVVVDVGVDLPRVAAHATPPPAHDQDHEGDERPPTRRSALHAVASAAAPPSLTSRSVRPVGAERRDR